MAISKSKPNLNNALTTKANLRPGFINEIHKLLAAAYKKLIRKELENKLELAISGLLAHSMKNLVDDPTNKTWAHFTIHDDPPQNTTAAEGRDRPRVDIEVESSELVPHPRFQFEAKRLYRSDSVSKYVGEEGLQCFLSGIYATGHPEAGMLGYVQADTEDDWTSKIEKKLSNERKEHKLAKTGDVWSERALSPGLKHSYLSTHQRADKSSIDIYHTFLRCY
jgi:hypothetical protein